ncbi:MAG: T9SS type A sorting domain-containing protein [Bacteroidota bacterium]|nr:T9SS type A sorting domain-containing protein [Bacteroidota bacterium]
MDKYFSIILFLFLFFISNHNKAQNFSLDISANPESVCSENQTQIRAIPINSNKFISQQTTTNPRPTVTITFASPVSETDFTIAKADLKYNKDFAYSIQLDDGLIDIYNKAFPLLEGGEVDGTTYPGLTYTDGCGNPINFKLATAHFSWNGYNQNSMHDPSNGYTGTLTWSQMIEMYQNKWGIYNHGFYDNGTEGGLSYDVARNHSFTILNSHNTILGGIQMKAFVIPASNVELGDFALDQNYHLILSNNYSYGSHNLDINEDDYYNIEVSRHNIDDVGIESTVDILAEESINGVHKWTTGFGHTIGGSTSISFATFANECTNVEEKYGSSGDDNLWFATGEEVQDYLYIKDNLSVNTQINSNTVTLTFSGSLPSDFRFYALSLLIDSDKSITNIQITDGFNNTHNLNYNNKTLINLNWDERVITTSEDLAEEAVAKTEESLNKYDALIAIDYIEIIENPDLKNYYKSRLCATGVEVPTGYCEGIDNYTYEWVKNGSFFSNTPSITDTPSNTSTYSVVVTNQNNQTAEAEITVNVIQPPQLNAGTTEEACSNQPFQLSASASNYSSIIWETRGDGIFNNNTLASPTYTAGDTDIEDGNVWLIVHALSNGCQPISDSVNITFTQSPTIETALSNNICQDQNYNPEITIQNYSSLLWQTQGDGNFSNPNITETTYSPGANDILAGETTLTITALSGAPCSYSVSKEISLIISPNPTVTAGNDTIICYSTSLITISAQTSNSSSALWNTTGTGSFINNGLTATYNISEQDKQNEEVKLFITAQADTPCTIAVSDTLSVEILPAPFAFAGNDSLVCGETEIQLSGSANNYNSVYWSTSGDGSFYNANSLNARYLPGENDKTTLSVNLTLHAIASEQCADESSDVITLTFPEQPNFYAGNDIDMCTTNDSVQLQATIANSDNYYWVTQGDGFFNDTTIINPVYYPGENEIANGAAFTGLKVASNAPCYNFITDYLKINIFENPTLHLENDTVICFGNNLELNAYAANYDSLFWTTTGDGIFSNTQTSITTYYPGTQDENNAQVKLFLRAVTHTGCEGETFDSLMVYFDAPAVINAGNDQIMCEYDNFIFLYGDADNYSSIQWTTSGDGSFSNANIINPKYYPATQDIQNRTVVLTMHVESNIGCDATLHDELTLSITSAPYVFAGNNDTICNDENIYLNGEITNENSFVWSTLGDGTFNSTNTASSIYTPGENDILSGDVRLKLTAQPISPCSEMAIDFVDFHFNPAPQININTDTVTIMAGDTYSPQTTGAYYSSIQWLTSGTGYFTPNNSINTQYTPSAQDKYSGMVTLTVIAHPQNSCSNIHVDNVILIIEPLPEIYAGSDILSCENETSVELSGTYESQNNTVWSTSGNGTFNNQNSLNTNYYFGDEDYVNENVTITLASQSNPNLVYDELIITINHTPTVYAGNPNQTICGSEPFTLSPQINYYSQLLWSTNGDGNFDDTTIANATYTSGQADILQGSVTLTLTAVSLAGCEGQVADDLTLSINPSPFANAGEDITACALDENIEINDASVENANSTLWETSGTGSFTNTDLLQTVYHPSNQDCQNGNVTLTLTASSNGLCSSSHSDDKLINFAENAEVEITETENSCNGNPVTISASAADYSYITWITDGDGSFSSLSELTTLYTPGITDITIGDFTLSIIAFGNNQCESYSDTSHQNIEIIPMPTINAGQDIETCETNSIVVSGTGENFGSLLWTTAGDGDFLYLHNIETIYFPGSQDIQNGEVELTLTAYAQSSCNDSVSDNITITFGSSPAIPNTPQGDTILCQETVSSMFTTENILGATSYQWQLTPNDLGNIIETTTEPTTTVNWFNSSTGTYHIRVKATNNCGDSYYSDYLYGVIHETPAVNIFASPDTIVCNNQTITLDATTQLASSYLWFPNNEETAIISVDSTGNNSGKVFRKILFTDIYGCTNSDSINVYFTVCTDIFDDSNTSAEIKISPNPAKKYINIYSNSAIYNADIEIQSNKGETIESLKNKTITKNNPLHININNYAAGIYFVKVESIKKSYSLKFIVLI